MTASKDDKDDKFIMMNMHDKRSKKVAEAMGNETCKKILDYLTYNSDKSEEDIAKALGMKINTIEYNLKKLLDAGLVEKVKKFFWSKKGKKIPLYKLAKKHIVISPKYTRPDLTALKTIIPAVVAIAIVVVLLILLAQPQGPIQQDEMFKKFNSMNELGDFLQENQAMAGVYGGADSARASLDIAGAEPSMAIESAPKAESAQDYSETNIQVEGVDEPDIVKNDGKYIYAVSGNKIAIVNAYPAEDMEILSEINVSGVINIFINEDKLIVFAYDYKDGQKTIAYIYDVSDRQDPELEKEISVDGNYISARMINDYVYLIANQYVGYNDINLPRIAVDGVAETVAVRDIGYFPHTDTSYTFTNILAINIQDGDYNSETYLAGRSNVIYVSEDNIYLTYTKRINPQDYYEELIDEVILPLLPSKQEAEVKDIMDSDDSLYEKMEKVGEIVTDYSDSLTGSEKADFDADLAEAMQEFSIKLQKKTEKTVIHKIEISEDSIEYITNGEVPGRLLNQFSMDEHKGNFRITTTTGNTWGSATSLNHLYVLDQDLEITGSVDDLAKGERIYSTRFMGDRAYMVTFRQVDPLFVIDLSDPENPEVLGQLKVTGFSSYLHPYDENHIIGVGKEATEEGRVQGVKIAIFDVSDVENPIERAKYEVEEKWSNSNALYDHKAFLFDKERNLLVLPMSYRVEGDSDTNTFRYNYWQGAYVFDISKNDISLRGKIDHKPLDEEQAYYYGPYAVQRSLYMDDVLYTISRSLIKTNDLTDLDEISSVDLPYEDYRKVGPGPMEFGVIG
jgi:uncharacterized secreted protein with C-terminal beta-propeller domain